MDSTYRYYLRFGVRRLLASGNKEKVLLAAMDLFHQKGFQTTGLEEILAQSGVCKSNFYYHFKSKDELGMAVLEEKIKEMQRGYIVPTLENRSLDAQERIVRFFREMIRFCEEHECYRGCMFGNFTLELADHHEAMRLRLSGFFRDLAETIRKVLQEGQGAGTLDLRGMAPEDVSNAAVSLLQGGILLAKGYKDTGPLVSSLDLLICFIGDSRNNS